MASNYICTQCGTTGQTRKVVEGSFLLEVVLWFFFLLPGMIYSVWRLTTKHLACRVCGSGGVIPLGSPAAQQLLATMHRPVEMVDLRAHAPTTALTTAPSTPWGIPPDDYARARSIHGGLLDAVVAEVSAHPASAGAHIDLPLLTWLCDHARAGTGQQIQLEELLRSRGGRQAQYFS